MSEEIKDIKEETVEEPVQENVSNEEQPQEVAKEEPTQDVAEAHQESEALQDVKEESSQEDSVKEESPEAASESTQENAVKDEKMGFEKEKMARIPKFKRKVCRFCNDSKVVINYKNKNLLEDFITDRGKILPRRVTGTCAKHQRDVAREVKRARIIAIIPFVEK